MRRSDEMEFFEVFPWNPNFETGIALIDEQHQQLVGLVNRLAAHLAHRANPVALSQVFLDLTAYADYHFKTEEEIWHANFVDDEWFSTHQFTHNTFISKVAELRIERNSKHLDEVIGEVLTFLIHWLAYHILDTDKRMAKAVLAFQSGISLEQAKKQADAEMSGAMKVLIDTVLNMYDSLSSRTMDLMREKAERRRAEEALKASEDRWKFVLDEAGDGVWDWNIASGDVYHSGELVSILNFTNAEVSSSEKLKTIHPDDILRVKKDLDAHLEGRSDVFINEHRILRKDGTWSWVLTRGKVTERDAAGSPLRMIGTDSDITERELASLVFKNGSEAMMVTDAENNIVTVNPSFTTITGYTLNEVVGKNPRILSSGRHDPEFYRSMWQEIQSTGGWQGEIWNRRKNGETYPEWLAISTILNPDKTVHHRVAQFSDISKKKQSEDIIWRQANFDDLTGLPNRNMMHDRLEQEIRKAHRAGAQMALMFIDLDHFKEINDALGHPIGDLLLKESAQRIKGCVRESDTVARLGGDEFTVIVAELDAPIKIQRIAQKILRTLSAPFYLEGEMAYVSASIGITLFPDDGTDSAELLNHADQAMYEAKNLGRNRFSYFTKTMQEAAQQRLRMANDLRQGLSSNQFIVYYQPIVELASGSVHKAEALIRWQHPTRGMISPVEFIPIAEETGLIIEIGNWVFREAVDQVAQWRTSHHADFQVSINKSPVQFRSDGERHTHTDWFAHLEKRGLPGQSITVEITEGLLMDTNDNIACQLLDFRDEGIQVALDDFGTGYSALSYLNKFDIDYIKIDQLFTRNLTADSDDLALCEAIVVMAHKLGMKVIAEGIETEEQRSLLLAAGCDYGQGYLFSKPIPPAEFSVFLSDT